MPRICLPSRRSLRALSRQPSFAFNPIFLKLAFGSRRGDWLPVLARMRGVRFGWGRKRSGWRAVGSGSRYLLLEDGFIRSWAREDDSLSLCMDGSGIYYDARSASDLERLIGEPLAAAEAARARALARRIAESGVSKYNALPEWTAGVEGPFVLVVDQVRGDASIAGGLADAGSFARMLAAARTEHPDATVVVKVHPDRHLRGKAGYFDPEALAGDCKVRVVAEACHSARLIDSARAVYCVTSQIGFEALLRGKPVRCFGMPFYAGWGLTGDDLPAPARRGRASLEQLVHAALVRYCRYLSPETGEPCAVEVVIEHLARQRQWGLRFAGAVDAVGFSPWKRAFLRQWLGMAAVRFHDDPHSLPAAEGAVAPCLVWGMRWRQELAARPGVVRVEDGFLRSVGLGAGLVRPLSLVFDDLGIYYDATRPSRLEALLQAGAFAPADVARAEALMARIADAGISKYNLPASRWRRPPTERRVLLAVGQVESDASIAWGGAGMCSNLDLLRAMRAEHPDAFIVYKPHPDVVAGLRDPGAERAAELALCDEVVTAGDGVSLLGEVDEVHTITSLLGFEALMRGSRVVCHGMPFYAGWGLTSDRQACARRTRRLQLAELVAGVLIAYPGYFDYETGAHVTAERIVERLQAARAAGPGVVARARQAVVAWLRG